MIGTLFLLAAPTWFTFTGGDENAFATALASHTKRNVTLFALENAELKEIRILVNDEKELIRRLTTLTGYAPVRDGSEGAAPARYPLGFHFANQHGDYAAQFAPPRKAPEISEDGTITFRTRGKEALS